MASVPFQKEYCAARPSICSDPWLVCALNRVSVVVEAQAHGGRERVGDAEAGERLGASVLLALPRPRVGVVEARADRREPGPCRPGSTTARAPSGSRR